MEREDPFGFKTQGQNYEQHRPEYPSQIIDSIHTNLKGNDKYLDVATGTGQILFKLAPLFTTSIGTDIS